MLLLLSKERKEHMKDCGPGHTAQMAATALCKAYVILRVDNVKVFVNLTPKENSFVPRKIDPLDG